MLSKGGFSAVSDNFLNPLKPQKIRWGIFGGVTDNAYKVFQSGSPAKSLQSVVGSERSLSLGTNFQWL